MAAISKEIALKDLNYTKAFTKVYQENLNNPLALREAACLKVQYPALCGDIGKGHMFAGKVKPEEYTIKFSTQADSSTLPLQCGYSLNKGYLLDIGKVLGGAFEKDAEELAAYWDQECTFRKVHDLYPQELNDYCRRGRIAFLKENEGNILHNINIRMAGVMLDYDKLLRLGIPGLLALLEEKKAKTDEAGRITYSAMKGALEALTAACRYYEDQAKKLAAETLDIYWKKDLFDMAEALNRIQHTKPGTLREAIQLFWLYTIVAETRNYGRMDIYLGDFYANDLNKGTITSAEADRMLENLWRMIFEQGFNPSDMRIVVGGLGRRNEENADAFALAAMEATRRHKKIVPPLTLRFYKGQNPKLMDKAFDVIGEGCLYPMLYNDDLNVPGVQEQFCINREDAEQYLPLGCGEYIIDKKSIGSPNTVMNLTKALEAVLHNGKCGISGRTVGLKTGELREFTTFDRLYEAFKVQLDYAAEMSVRNHLLEYEGERSHGAFLFNSILLDDCIDRGRTILEGGVRYLGGCIEGFGFTNAGDSLMTIKDLVYDKKIMSLEKLVQILDANFEGYDREHKMMLDTPKFGNDSDAVDHIVVDLCSYISRVVNERGREKGLDFYIISSVNPGGFGYGRLTAASADGRKKNAPFAVGNSPTAGYDKSGLTALMNSVSKSSPVNGGMITNFKLSRQMFLTGRKKTEAMFDAYFENGGFQANITVVNRGDLEAALKEPEKWPHLLVRMGGWSARYIDLSRDMQIEVLNRTLY